MYKSLVPVSPERHRDLSWRGYSDYGFAFGEAVIPLIMSELPRASADMPIGFVRQQDEVSPVAICSLLPGKNYYIAPDGRWLGGYVPALLRAYPFALLRNPAEQGAEPDVVVCIDEGSGLLTERADLEDAQPFFDEEDKPVGKFAQVLNFLTQLQRDRQITRNLCALIDQYGLLAEWPLKVDMGEGATDVTGILRIDEDALLSVSDEVFLDLRRKGALPYVYTQLLSLQRIANLSRMAQVQGQLMQAQPSLADAFEIPFDDGLEFNFD